MKIIFYVAKYGTIWDQLIALRTWGPYSHVELMFSDGMCFSSSPRDGGTRFKKIQIDPVHWTALDFPTDKEDCIRKWCEKQVGKPYDWLGILGLAIDAPIIDDNKIWYCSKVCTAAIDQYLAYNKFIPIRINPNKLYKILNGR